MEEIGIERARNQLGEIVDQARLAERPTLITRQGKPAAVVVNSDWYEAIGALLADLEAVDAYRAKARVLREGRRAAGLNPQDNRVVHHIDGNPWNNDLDNLRIMGPEGERPVSHHPAKRLTAPDGEPADIDLALVPLIEALWDGGYDTIGCCQDAGESIGDASPRKAAHWKGYVLLEMPVPDACNLIETVKRTREFRGYMHWADDGAWEVTVPLLNGAPSYHRAQLSPWAQLHFPATQLDDLVAVVTRKTAALRSRAGAV